MREPSGWSERSGQSGWSELSVQSGLSGPTGWRRVARLVGVADVVGVRGGQDAKWTDAPLTSPAHCYYPLLTLHAMGPLLHGHDLACHWPFLEGKRVEGNEEGM